MKRFGFIFLTTIALAGSAWGDSAPRFDTGPLDNGQTTTNVKPKILDNVGIDQKLDSQLPMDAVFTDETGHMGKLSEFFHGRPVLLSLVQFDCQKLCTLELNGLCRAANGVALQPGKDYDILTVSFDPRETSQFAALKKRTYESQINRDGVSGAWHFLTGSADSIQRITDAAGFRYVYDAPRDQYVHSAALFIVTPDGHVSKYLYGAEYAPNDLRLAIADASQSKIGSLSDAFLLFCFHYDPESGKYTLAVRNLLRVGAGLVLAAVSAFVIISIRREKPAAPAI